MTGTTRGTHRIWGARLAVIALLACAVSNAPTHGASVSYPDLGPIPPGFTFTGITESSVTDGVPLYGAPTAFPIGLSFTPTGFGAGSSGGGIDLTDGQLNYTIVAGPAAGGISVISFAEGGLFSLSGTGTSNTEVLAGASLIVTILELNGVAVAPINLAPSVSSLAYNLTANPGLNQTWNVSVSTNVAAQLAILGYAPSQRATKATVSIDNALVAISETLSAAAITKADFDVHVAPEPASGAIAAMALLAVGGFGRRRRG
jgi:MYXO-CTERM domain-containing protein